MDPFRVRSIGSLCSIVLVLLTLCVCSIVITSAVATAVPVIENTTNIDKLTLLSFKSQLSDPLRALASWSNEFLHFCGWRGVTCGRRHSLRVIALDLDSLGLAGSISPYIANLTFLRRLHLPSNKLHGHIPQELGHLSRLRYLNLSMNSLEGEIPTGFGSFSKLETLILRSNKLTGCIPPLLGSSPSLAYVYLQNNSLTGGIPPFLANSSTLQVLILSTNRLTGGIPSSLGNSSSLIAINLASNDLTGGIPPFLTNPSSLVFLRLTTNKLTGDIPPSLGNLTSLQHLSLADNNFEGSIPESLGNIRSLQQLDLSINSLFGKIPSSLYNISTITYLGLGHNRLSGTLPPDMGLTLPSLQNLLMQANRLEGPIPVSLSNASGLQILYLGNNTFSGLVPPNLGSLQNLRQLNIGWNNLEAHDWSFLSSMTNCSLLENLYLQQNKLQGALPSSLANLSTRLEILFIGENQISGTLPAEIGNLVNLTVLFMNQNLFMGNIPATIGKLRNLIILELSRNKFSGPIPSSLGNLTQLNELYTQENELSGDIPSSFGNCRSLGTFNLSHNALGGTIPRELVSLSSLTQFLDLSHNSLIGSIPLEVGQLINLERLYISDNQLSGDIPPTVGACQVLEQLHMDGNFFQGTIPLSFESLKGLNELDLSRNNLSGQIPDFFTTFGTLQLLNLSFNDFEGEIPSGGVFDNASEFSVLGNKKLCGGYPKLQLQSCSVRPPQRRFNPVKVIIPAMSAVLILLLGLLGILYRRKKTGPSVSSSEDDKYRKVSYAEIYEATDGFSATNVVGTGSFGCVYKGKLDFEEIIVAVKVLDIHQKGALKSFNAECEALRNIRHRNIIKIITVCSSLDPRGTDFKALVFKYIPNGSLEEWLHPEVFNDHRQHRKLTFIQMLNIAIDVAAALDYLHNSCQPPVVHCDLKPSNVLLDNDMTAHVGDFGLARFLCKSISTASKNSTSFMGIKGSIGYVAPEYGIGNQVSIQGDMYSFGVLLLEMLTGKKPTDDIFKDGLDLHKYVEMAFPESVINILDPHLLQDEDEEANNKNINKSASRVRTKRCIFSLIRIGLLCSNDSPRERMVMRDVVNGINIIKERLSVVDVQEEK